MRITFLAYTWLYTYCVRLVLHCGNSTLGLHYNCIDKTMVTRASVKMTLSFSHHVLYAMKMIVDCLNQPIYFYSNKLELYRQCLYVSFVKH